MKIFKRTAIAAMNKISGSLTSPSGPVMAYVNALCALYVDGNGMNNARGYATNVVQVTPAPSPLYTSSRSPHIPSYGTAIATTPLTVTCYATEVAAIIAVIAVINFNAQTSGYTDLTTTYTIRALGVTRTLKMGVYWERTYGPRYAELDLL